MLDVRINKIKELLKSTGSECLLLAPGVDMFYCTGVATGLSERLTMSIIPVNNDPIFLCPQFEKSRLEKDVSKGIIKTWTEEENPFKLLAGILRDLNLEQKQLALDDKLWFEWFLKIQKELPKAKFTNSKSVVSESRIIKTNNELILMKQATKITCLAIISTIDEAKPGMTEKEIASILAEKINKSNGVVAFNAVQTGPNSALPHADSSDRKLEKNDVLLIDVGTIYKGYVGDITTTNFVGKPSDKFNKIYKIVFNANRQAFKNAKEGVIAENLDIIARELITKEGYGQNFTHRLGHGIGLEVHEPPYIVKGNKTILREGMCHTIEPGIYLLGEFGVRIEDNVVIRKNNCEFLYEPPR